MRLSLKLIIMASIILLVNSAMHCSGSPLAERGQAADFTLESLNGGKVSLSSYKNQSPVILSFWTTWCPYCVAEMKHLNRIYSDLKSKGFELLAINIEESKTKIDSFVAKHQLSFPILLDSETKVAKDYGVTSIPAVFIIDKSGQIKYRGNELPVNYLEFAK